MANLKTVAKRSGNASARFGPHGYGREWRLDGATHGDGVRAEVALFGFSPAQSQSILQTKGGKIFAAYRV